MPLDLNREWNGGYLMRVQVQLYSPMTGKQNNFEHTSEINLALGGVDDQVLTGFRWAEQYLRLHVKDLMEGL